MEYGVVSTWIPVSYFNFQIVPHDIWPADIDAMVALYSEELGDVLDSILSVRVLTKRPRLTDPWFDRE